MARYDSRAHGRVQKKRTEVRVPWHNKQGWGLIQVFTKLKALFILKYY